MRTCLTLLFAPDFRLRLNVKHTMLAEGRLLMIAVLIRGFVPGFATIPICNDIPVTRVWY